MAKKKLMNPSHVLIFVEGDTDEVFFKALIDYYASVSCCKLLPYDICKSVKRMGIEDFIRIGVKSSIEDWILDDLQGICSFLRLKQVPSSLKGKNGYQRMLDLYKRAHRTYKKGYETEELINALDMSAIRNKRQDVLALLEEALGVVVQ